MKQPQPVYNVDERMGAVIGVAVMALIALACVIAGFVEGDSFWFYVAAFFGAFPTLVLVITGIVLLVKR